MVGLVINNESQTLDKEVGIWIWENYGTSPNYDSCIAEKADIVEIFDGAFVISCDKKGHKKK